MRCLGWSKRVKSPSAATMGTATVHGTSRRACSASTTGWKRQEGTGAWSACSRRCSRCVCALTARTYSGKTMCWAGVGQTTALSHRRGGRAPGGRASRAPSVPEHKGFQTHLRGLEVAERLFPRAAQVAAGFICHCGDRDGGRSPERMRLANGIASRRSVCTRSPGCFGMREGATTQQSSPFVCRER